jgi:hypothetical protein
MISALSEFDKVTAAGLLARAALAMQHQENPAVAYKLPNEERLRQAVFTEARQVLGVPQDDDSPQTLERLGDILDSESESLIGPVDSEAALTRLAEKGELPSDLFQIEVIDDIKDFHGKRYPAELELIQKTVRSPDQEQHFGPPDAAPGKPVLISLFAKHFPNQYPLRSFTMLVVGQRNGLVLYVHQAWRIYADVVDLNGIKDLVDMLRRFSDVFGVEIELGDQKGRFILLADLPAGTTSLEASMRVKPEYDRFSPRASRRTYTMTMLTQSHPGGATQQAALAVGIDFTRYAGLLKNRGW